MNTNSTTEIIQLPVIAVSLESLLMGTFDLPDMNGLRGVVELHFATPWEGREVMTKHRISTELLQQGVGVKKHIGSRVIESIVRFVEQNS